MTKRRRSTQKTRQATRNPAQAKPPLEQAPGKGGEDIKALAEAELEKVLSITSHESRASILVGQPPAEPDLQASWRQLEEARRLYEMHSERAEAAKREAEVHREHYTTLENALEKRETKLQAEQRRLTAEQQDLEDKQELLTDQMDWLTGLREQEKRFRDDLLALTKDATEQTAAALLDLAGHIDNLRGDFQARLVQQTEAQLRQLSEEQDRINKEGERLAEEWITLEKQRQQLRRESLELKADQEILEEDRQSLDQLVSQRAEAELGRLQLEKQSYEKRLQDALDHNRELQERLDDREIAIRRFGDQEPEDVWRRLEELERERTLLEQEVASRPSQADLERLHELERERESWETERSQLRRQVQELKKSLSDHRLGVVELETLRDQKLAYEASNQILQKQLEELRADIDKQVAAASQRPPFPSCLAMDQDDELQQSPETRDVQDLSRFAEELQQRIGYDPQTKMELFYDLADIRSFLGGLSMSYLTILQGISGTGKTSLPFHFARAVGGGCEIIEVQAGWRDRQDLLGHYNSFERKYYESPFLQALYRAQCPLYKDRIFVILMDEMNLSYPEQYFADLISALEIPVGSRHGIRLMTETIEPEQRPKGLAEGGRSLPIPPNVWFIGTANQDETTKDFADKTYDRAHIIELPFRRPVVKLLRDGSPAPLVSFAGLQKAFEAAKKERRPDAEKCVEFLEAELRETLGSRFGIGWGHRLRDQLRRYVPVVIASGGSRGEALDYTLAMKVFRRVRNRYENRADDLGKLRDLLLSSWCELKDPYKEPRKSLAIIDEELRRLRFGEPVETA